ncbi:sterol carrier protein 2 isoform X3 [Hydra vulgaris]|uniref:Sterol carrier protein 2 n=1 Tax=Hydra vulgaris TaxID=6087 RepID=A0ABM4C8F8_HYDVU
MPSLTKRVFVCGVGMTKFEKPGARKDFDYPIMAKEAVTQALNDAGITYNEIQQAVCGYVYGDSTCGQRALYQFGLTGIPILNVNNNCSTGSSALFMAKQLIEGGTADCVLAVGFEKMERGSLGSKYLDRTIPLDKHLEVLDSIYGLGASPFAAQIFGNAGREHMEKYGTTKEHFAKIALKNHRHSVKNKRSQFCDEYTLDQILQSGEVHHPLTKLQCCPTSDGGAAAIICSETFLNKHSLHNKAVEILAMEMATDVHGTFEEKSMIKVAGQDMTKKAALSAFKKAGLTPNDVQVVELHDCFSTNELITYEGLGLCPEGKGGELVDQGDNTYGGKFVVNPSGGLISKGHPLGATGLAQCFEICSQLRGNCEERQVKNAVIGLQHNLGLGGACVVALYKKCIPLQEVVSEESSVESTFKSDVIFKEIEKRFSCEADSMKKEFNAVYCFELQKEENVGVWTIDLKTAAVIYRGKNCELKADCTIKMTDEDCFKMMIGQLNPQTAFLQGKLKISGNMAMAMKLQKLQVKNLKSNL